MGKQKLFKLGDRVSIEEAETLGLDWKKANSLFEGTKDGLFPRAVLTGEFRSPKKGEWYLSGAIPTAYKAPNDLSTEFRICKLVAMNRTTTVSEVIACP